MIVFYGKGKVGNAFHNLCTFLGTECFLVDDQSGDEWIGLCNRADIIVPTPWLSQQHEIYSDYADKIVSELDMCRSMMKDMGRKPHTIGITGTDGKSTVTWLIAEALRHIIPEHTYEVYITGNFDDALSTTIYSIIQHTTHEQRASGSISIKQPIFVMECSSFMLYALKEYAFDVWIWTNFAPDHLNRHPTLDEYFVAKQHLIEHSAIAFVNQPIHDALATELHEKTTVYNTVYDITKTNFIGDHNMRNCALAFQAVRAFCDEFDIIATDDHIHHAISTVTPLKHRMQPYKTIQGITRYDDGKSTSAQSLGAGLAWFSEKVIVMVWGSDKGDDFSVLTDLFREHVCFGVCLGQTAEKFAAVFADAWVPYTIVSSMEENVHIARNKAQEYVTTSIIFSPGCASFDMFKNYEDRAQQFLASVDSLVASE